MSTESAGCRRRELGEYVRLLIRRLGDSEPQGLRRIREIVGPRRARITLDDETVEVAFEGTKLMVEVGARGTVDGSGATDRQTTLDLLDGYLEVNEAILLGRLEVAGSVDGVARIFQSIQILLDASTRLPGLQELADDFRRDPCGADSQRAGAVRSRRTRFLPHGPDAGEAEMLRRLDLLPRHEPAA